MTVFLKLGGSLITDKATPETPRIEIIERLAEEIARATVADPDQSLVIGHGSGSFGHVSASEYGTRDGVSSDEEWRGFAEVSVVAARLNNILLETLHEADIPVMRIQPSASAQCRDGQIVQMAWGPLQTALNHHLVPLVYGDVAVDIVRGGTIISTEEIFFWLAERLYPTRILLAGDMDGVMDQCGEVIPQITRLGLNTHHTALSGSAATDVTGGMASKVESMLDLCKRLPELEVTIFSGLVAGNVENALLGQPIYGGTRIRN